MSRIAHPSQRARHRVRVATLVLITGLVAPGAAQAACVATPINQTFADPTSDSQSGLAPEASALTVTIDAACTATFSYPISNRPGLISGDFLGWFIDADGNASTGATSGFVGADYALGRNGSSAGVSRWDASAGKLVDSGMPVGLSGDYGVQLDLSTIAGFGSRVITVAGAASWRSSASGNTYYDWVPTPGASPFAVGIALAQYSPTPPPAPATPVPAASQPAPGSAPIATSTPGPNVVQATTDDELVCEVPRTKGLPLGQAKARLRRAGCTLGAIRYERSRTVSKGRIIRLSAPAYALLTADDRVRITVSSGPGRRIAAGR